MITRVLLIAVLSLSFVPAVQAQDEFQTANYVCPTLPVFTDGKVPLDPAVMAIEEKMKSDGDGTGLKRGLLVAALLFPFGASAAAVGGIVTGLGSIMWSSYPEARTDEVATLFFEEINAALSTCGLSHKVGRVSFASDAAYKHAVLRPIVGQSRSRRKKHSVYILTAFTTSLKPWEERAQRWSFVLKDGSYQARSNRGSEEYTAYLFKPTAPDQVANLIDSDQTPIHPIPGPFSEISDLVDE